MKRGYLFLFLALFLILPFSVSAEEAVTTSLIQPRDESLNTSQEANDLFVAGDNLNLTGIYDGTSFAVGSNVTSDAKVQGISFAFGNFINLTGASDYAMVAGNAITYDGTTEDLFMAGNSISLNSNTSIERDAYLAANDVIISGSINRNLYVAASTVSFNNIVIVGDIKIDAGTIDIGDNVNITGTITYNSDAKINGDTSKYNLNSYNHLSDNTNKSFGKVVADKLVAIAGMLLVALVLCFIAPKSLALVSSFGKEFDFKNVLKRVGIGFGTLVFCPIIFLLLFASTLGTQLSLLIIVVYIIAIYLSVIVTGYLVGDIILKKVFKKEGNKVIAMTIGVLLILVISYIPFIGSIVSFISVLFGMGIIFKLLFYKEA